MLVWLFVQHLTSWFQSCPRLIVWDRNLAVHHAVVPDWMGCLRLLPSGFLSASLLETVVLAMFLLIYPPWVWIEPLSIKMKSFPRIRALWSLLSFYLFFASNSVNMLNVVYIPLLTLSFFVASPPPLLLFPLPLPGLFLNCIHIRWFFLVSIKCGFRLLSLRNSNFIFSLECLILE